MTVKPESFPATLVAHAGERGTFWLDAGDDERQPVARLMESDEIGAALACEIARRYNMHDALVAALREAAGIEDAALDSLTALGLNAVIKSLRRSARAAIAKGDID